MSIQLKFLKHGKGEASTKRETCSGVHPRHAHVSFIDGIATLVDVFPEPRPRTIRAFKHYIPQWVSIDSALAHDWAVLGQDMWSAIKAHENEANEEAALATTERLSTR